MNFNVISPETTMELLETMTNNRDNEFKFGAGYTDLILELKNTPDKELTVINLAKLDDVEFGTIQVNDKGMEIGALVTIREITSEKNILEQYPVLHKAATQLASNQIRQVATVGGNLCTASPAGDIACALMALDADCQILSSKNSTRTIPLREFFTGVRKTVMEKDEVLKSISISGISNEKPVSKHSGFIKVGTRRSMECSVISLAFHFYIENSKIIHAGIAIGSAAPTIKYCETASEYLIGKDINSLSDGEKEEFAGKILEYASPISDIRATAWYRKEVLFNISKSIFDDM